MNNPLKYIDPSGFDVGNPGGDVGGDGPGYGSDNDGDGSGDDGAGTDTNTNNEDDEKSKTDPNNVEDPIDGVMEFTISVIYTTSKDNVEHENNVNSILNGSGSGDDATIEKATDEAVKSKGELETSGGVYAGIHVVFVGVTFHLNKNLKTNKYSFSTTVRVGPGLMAAAGIEASLSKSLSSGFATDKSNKSSSVGFGVDGGAGLVGGASASYDPGNGKASFGLGSGRFGYGLGASAGFDFNFGF